MRIAFLVKIDRSDCASVGIRFNAMHIGVGSNFATASALCYANRGREGAGFCAHFTAETEAVAALHTGAPARARLRKNRHWGREGMPAKFASSAFKEHAGRFNG